jgi:TolB-like protein/DNA-binding winged helix-turn-helix (wHTH) protein/Tfp pilus assembly protein PilF
MRQALRGDASVVSCQRLRAADGAVKARFGQFEVDLDARELRKAGIRIKIHEQPFQVLEALLERPGEVVSRDELRHRIWPENTFIDFDQSLNKAVNRVRAALGDNAANPRFVETLSRRGYRLLVPVERPEPAVTSTIVAAAPDPVATGVARRRWLSAAVVAIVLVAAFALWSVAQPAQIRSLVVLPLTNLSGDREQEYFVDGITEAITTELASIPGLRVVSTTSAMQYKAAKKPLPVIARDLRVDGVIEGSLLRTGNRMRMLLKLIEARSDRPLWAETYDVDAGDVLRLQNNVVRQVASEIRLKLNPEKRGHPPPSRRIEPAALDAYLRGYALAQLRTEPELKRSIVYFQQAIAADPGYARAYAGLGISYQFLVSYGLFPAREGYRRQVEAAGKALELDSTMAEAHNLLALAKLYGDWDWPAAQKSYKRAIDLSPSHAVNHQRYALALMWMGRFDDALTEITVAQELDPLAVIHKLNEGEIYYNGRQYDRATEQCRRAVEADPKFFGSWAFLGLSCVAKGGYDEGTRALQHAVGLGGAPETRSKLGYALAKSGRVKDALHIADELTSMHPRYPSAYEAAIVYAGLGDKERAFEWLKKSYDAHSRQMVYLGVTPMLDSLRSDPRFTALVNQVGLVR